MQQLVLGLSGKIGAGKTTAAEYLARAHGAKTYRVSDFIRDALLDQGMPLTRQNFVQTSQILRDRFGEDILSKRLLWHIERDAAPLVVIDGIRLLPDHQHLSENAPGYHLVHIHADLHERYQRVVRRNEKPGEHGMTFADFLDLHMLETERYQDTLAGCAHFLVVNDRTWTEMFHNLVAILDQIRNTTP